MIAGAKKARPLPTQKQLRDLLDYNPETGILTWRERPLRYFSASTEALKAGACKRWNKRYAGTTAGADMFGYLQVKIFDRNMLAHRIIWVMVHGYWPEEIDHINGNPSDNRLVNLRHASRTENARNQKRHCTNTSGRTGVHWNRFTQYWVASIRNKDRTLYLGSYDEFQEAVAAREVFEKKLGFTGRQ